MKVLTFASLLWIGLSRLEGGIDCRLPYKRNVHISTTVMQVKITTAQDSFLKSKKSRVPP
eukprot:scaffold3840_cov129-Cylindrotheca_fusiformis.AAC.16